MRDFPLNILRRLFGNCGLLLECGRRSRPVLLLALICGLYSAEICVAQDSKKKPEENIGKENIGKDIESSPAGSQTAPKSADSVPGQAINPLSNDPLSKESFGNQPTYIKSNTLVLRSKDRVFVYSGTVEVRQGDMTLTSDSLEGKYDQDNQVQELVALNNVVIVKGDNIRANGNKAIYRKENETVTLTENPELQQEGSVLTADAITIYLNENRSQAEGNVRVKLVQKDEAQEGKKSAALKDLT